MSETEQITVAERSPGFGGAGETGTEVSLPVVELLTGRGFVTGKSGSGKSNSASVVAEKLLDNGFGLLIVDIDGEYYGLKEEYEILHAGADEECDIQISADHAEKLASLALEQNVPIILDISSYLDESEAEAVLTAVARSLFAKAKKQKQPFLLLVEEVHEYIPENGSVGECGRMLIKIGKRGRKHGLGICGISQRPADVKKDFITQCDWLLWHRLTWNNDTKVVGRILDNDYADAVEDLDDGEGFLMTDWAETIQRVQFFRKQTFDAGATPGLEDFERPELKSVSDDLVSELEEISDEKQQRENEIQELREELDRKNSRIAELERELQDARDLSRMAEQFVDSLVEEVNGAQPGRTERERRRENGKTTAPDLDSGPELKPETTTNGDGASADEGDDGGFGEAFAEGNGFDDDAFEGLAESADEDPMDGFGESDDEEMEPEGESEADDGTARATDGEVASADGGAVAANGAASEFSADAVLEALNSVTEMASGRDGESQNAVRQSTEFIDADGTEQTTATESEDAELVVRELKADIGGLATKTRKMLEFYRETGPETPLNAHFSAGGDGTRTDAYAHNRRLRTRGLIQHAGRGHYEYRVPELLEQRLADRGIGVDEDTLEEYVADIEDSALQG
ncbi:helicase HerA domain-containing protein [Halovenus halobia]|uniref:helicase HerA domain-containing protein n=1 Tax=Halovenus halobia TaxID=3396622 RepID=UPI003F548CFD